MKQITPLLRLGSIWLKDQYSDGGYKANTAKVVETMKGLPLITASGFRTFELYNSYCSPSDTMVESWDDSCVCFVLHYQLSLPPNPWDQIHHFTTHLTIPWWQSTYFEFREILEPDEKQDCSGSYRMRGINLLCLLPV